MTDSSEPPLVTEEKPAETPVKPAEEESAKTPEKLDETPAKPAEPVEAEIPKPRNYYRNLDLQASRDGRDYYFSQSEWKKLRRPKRASSVPKAL